MPNTNIGVSLSNLSPCAICESGVSLSGPSEWIPVRAGKTRQKDQSLGSGPTDQALALRGLKVQSSVDAEILSARM
jgi:hypothetical protein